jgi:hypothetical protein
VSQVNPVGTIKRGGRWRLDRDTHVGTVYVGSRRIDEEAPTGYHDAPVLHLRVDTVIGSVKVYRV